MECYGARLNFDLVSLSTEKKVQCFQRNRLTVLLSALRESAISAGVWIINKYNQSHFRQRGQAMNNGLKSKFYYMQDVK